jgi:hypothetical protein
MAWINEPSGYYWDVPYTNKPRAVVRAQDLSVQYKALTDVVEREGQFLIRTLNTITEPHSVACRCDECVAL